MDSLNINKCTQLCLNITAYEYGKYIQNSIKNLCIGGIDKRYWRGTLVPMVHDSMKIVNVSLAVTNNH
jgi:hypothetical protein